VISAKLDVKKDIDSYAIVAIGKQNAKTKVVKDTREPVWEENFAIGYEKEDEDSEIIIDVFEKGKLMDERLGEFRLKLGQLDPPKKKNKAKEQPKTDAKGGKTDAKGGKTDAKATKPVDEKNKDKKEENWANAKPQEAPLGNKKGERVGTLMILLRRELRLHGQLKVDIKELVLTSLTGPVQPKPSKIVVKLGQQDKSETAVTEPKVGKKDAKYSFKHTLMFVVHDGNNISDVFFELWQDDKVVGETRLTLYDTRKKFDGNITIISNAGGSSSSSSSPSSSQDKAKEEKDSKAKKEDSNSPPGYRLHIGQLKIFAKLTQDESKN